MQKEVEFVGIHDMFLNLQEPGAGLLSDGLHPNSRGHELIARIVTPVLETVIK
jgi:lysophospholipase L1-like esterase